ncbi:MAG TPA: tetratricopeptide repeat protein, partial [Steroidobacteraceae bacterium]|nr:tetratricopeptide repeat protein [Steroidobacteraceae bacterium]
MREDVRSPRRARRQTEHAVGRAFRDLARAQLTWNLRNRFPHERAIVDLQRALSINPNLAEAYVELGKVLRAY